jgi:NADH-quinone oxidoreductase subunit L
VLDAVWLIPALPLAGFLVLLALGRRIGEPGAGWIATAACGGSFVATVVVYAGLLGEDEHGRSFVQTLFEWMPVGDLQVDIGFLADPLSITMALFVTGVGTLIHLYAIGYMHGDRDFPKFFVYMNLFVFSMLMLVLGSNLLVTFIGWEGVGACSYFLVSFWFTDEANASAGKKAFITNRVGDWGFLLAMFVAFSALGTLDYAGITAGAEDLAPVTATAIGLLLFVGAVGKSAQIPLYIWLPDAMAGPTPVSALIHAATMVTGGVFLMTRVNPILGAGYEWAPDVIAWIGALTALVAATIAVGQNDIKKVLAYSTVSQLGYMFLAVGVGAYVAAIFHMVTHAFFKAQLFLGAGSVIHGMHDEQDMRRMGGLRKVMPITAATTMVGWLAISGVPPFSGFFSKDEILLYTWGSGGTQSRVLWAIGLVTALLTAYYMSRLIFLTFFGRPRWNEEVPAPAPQPASVGAAAADEPLGEARHGDEAHGAAVGEHGGGHVEPHESPWIMTVPLIVLAVLAAVGEVINLPFTTDLLVLEHWLEPVVEADQLHIDVATGTKITLAIIAIAAAVIGIAAAALVYLRRRVRAVEPAVLAHAWYYDESITRFVGGPGTKGFGAVAWFDAHIIDGAVNGVATIVRTSGRGLRRVQSGFVRSYALGISAGVVVVLGYFLARLYV